MPDISVVVFPSATYQVLSCSSDGLSLPFNFVSAMLLIWISYLRSRGRTFCGTVPSLSAISFIDIISDKYHCSSCCLPGSNLDGLLFFTPFSCSRLFTLYLVIPSIAAIASLSFPSWLYHSFSCSLEGSTNPAGNLCSEALRIGIPYFFK